MRAFAMTLMVLLLITSGCENPSNQGDANIDNKKEKVYGGTFRIGLSEKIQSFHPLSAIDVNSYNVVSQIFECLVKLDPKTLDLLPGLAEKWEIDEKGTTYRFYLKKGVLFHDAQCFNQKSREMTANDVIFSIKKACTADSKNKIYDIALRNKIKGADEYYENTKTNDSGGDIEGLRVISNYVVEIELSSPDYSFLHILSMPSLAIYSEIAFEAMGADFPIGTGAFRISSGQKIRKNSVVLLKNEDYYRKDEYGNDLPFLDTLKFLVVGSKKAELQAFQNNELNIVFGLPTESIKNIVEEQIANFQMDPPLFLLDRAPEMSTQFYSLNLNSKFLQKKKVRQALNYAIDRDKIVNDILKGEAFGPGINGICPPSFKGYENSSLVGYNYDIEKAKKLLKEAGYPNGQDAPRITLKVNTGAKNVRVVLEILKQWKQNLGIDNIDLDIVSLSERLESEKNGDGDVFRSGWIADYPDPQSFLSLFYGKNVPKDPTQESYPNTTRFINEEFDQLYEKAVSSRDQKERFDAFLAAEKVLIEEAPVIVLYYEEKYVLLKSYVQDFHYNPLRAKDFAVVYFKQPKSKNKK
ncbi:MAG: peptide ABC transporter substrate-binding protein [Flavobacteriales bacterium]|nr:peptide ABC transporter substrate-binding protein [Flavobacteriales bacterium]